MKECRRLGPRRILKFGIMVMTLLNVANFSI